MFYNIKTEIQGKEGGERMEWVHLIIYIRAHENGRYERGRFFNYRENSFSWQGRKVSYVGKIIGIGRQIGKESFQNGTELILTKFGHQGRNRYFCRRSSVDYGAYLFIKNNYHEENFPMGRNVGIDINRMYDRAEWQSTQFPLDERGRSQIISNKWTNL